MTSNVQSDGNTVTVTTVDGHRIGFAMAELNAASTSREITTEWARGETPSSPEDTVREAKAEAEAYVARHHPSKPDEARQSKADNKGLGGALKDMLGLP